MPHAHQRGAEVVHGLLPHPLVLTHDLTEDTLEGTLGRGEWERRVGVGKRERGRKGDGGREMEGERERNSLPIKYCLITLINANLTIASVTYGVSWGMGLGTERGS